MALSIDLKENDLSEFAIHAVMLETWSRKMNLTSIKDPVELAKRHFSEGIVAGNWLRRHSAGGPMLDLGSGNGFPAVPMAVIFRKARPIILIESSEKKSAFLRALIRELGWLDARVEQRRVKKSSDLEDLPCQIFSTRGVAIAPLLRDGLPCLQSGGFCILFGSRVSLGLDSAGLPKGFSFVDELSLPARETGIVILCKS